MIPEFELGPSSTPFSYLWIKLIIIHRNIYNWSSLAYCVSLLTSQLKSARTSTSLHCAVPVMPISRRCIHIMGAEESPVISHHRNTVHAKLLWIRSQGVQRGCTPQAYYLWPQTLLNDHSWFLGLWRFPASSAYMLPSLLPSEKSPLLSECFCYLPLLLFCTQKGPYSL